MLTPAATPTYLDRVLAYLAPQWALRRQRARAVLRFEGTQPPLDRRPLPARRLTSRSRTVLPSSPPLRSDAACTTESDRPRARRQPLPP